MMQILVCFSDYVTMNASKRTQFLTRGRTQALWRRDAGRADARCGHHGGWTRVLWRQDAGRVDKLFLGSTVVLINQKYIKISLFDIDQSSEKPDFCFFACGQTEICVRPSFKGNMA